MDPRTLHALDQRGVTVEEHETKMRNLALVSRGGARITKIEHDAYRVDGWPGVYNPYTNHWDISGEKAHDD